MAYKASSVMCECPPPCPPESPHRSVPRTRTEDELSRLCHHHTESSEAAARPQIPVRRAEPRSIQREGGSRSPEPGRPASDVAATGADRASASCWPGAGGRNEFSAESRTDGLGCGLLPGALRGALTRRPAACYPVSRRLSVAAVAGAPVGVPPESSMLMDNADGICSSPSHDAAGAASLSPVPYLSPASLCALRHPNSRLASWSLQAARRSPASRSQEVPSLFLSRMIGHDDGEAVDSRDRATIPIFPGDGDEYDHRCGLDPPPPPDFRGDARRSLFAPPDAVGVAAPYYSHRPRTAAWGCRAELTTSGGDDGSFAFSVSDNAAARLATRRRQAAASRASLELPATSDSAAVSLDLMPRISPIMADVEQGFRTPPPAARAPALVGRAACVDGAWEGGAQAARLPAGTKRCTVSDVLAATRALAMQPSRGLPHDEPEAGELGTPPQRQDTMEPLDACEQRPTHVVASLRPNAAAFLPPLNPAALLSQAVAPPLRPGDLVQPASTSTQSHLLLPPSEELRPVVSRSGGAGAIVPLSAGCWRCDRLTQDQFRELLIRLSCLEHRLRGLEEDAAGRRQSGIPSVTRLAAFVMRMSLPFQDWLRRRKGIAMCLLVCLLLFAVVSRRRPSLHRNVVAKY